MIDILAGDCRDVLPTLPECSVQMCVTSPPYFGLRDYGVDGQIGLESNVDAYVAELAAVFAEVRRVLADDGTLWLNLGDSYGSGKQLLGIPWRVAFALQADGWYLRSDIIWHKPNPMPESVTDRPTKAHEYLFLLSKRPTYFYDAEAVKERAVAVGRIPGGNHKVDASRNDAGRDMPIPVAATRNRRSVWTVSTKPYKGAHFATFPPNLIEPCIRAGTSERGQCPACGTPWRRVVERTKGEEQAAQRPKHLQSAKSTLSMSGGSDGWTAIGSKAETLGWEPQCRCDAGDPVPQTVLDPFFGAGTTALVAQQHGRDCLGIELNPDYITLAERRLGIAEERAA